MRHALLVTRTHLPFAASTPRFPSVLSRRSLLQHSDFSPQHWCGRAFLRESERLVWVGTWQLYTSDPFGDFLQRVEGLMEGEVSLPPGFRFHPTDEELLSYYLKRKVQRKTIRFNAIAEIDVYKSEPWDLPARSLLKSRDLEWYFFSPLDRKYGNGSRTNRATELGFWKTTGKDRTIMRNLKMIGMKKTLVYHKGRAPHGERTNWVMHEYRLEEEGSLSSSGNLLDAYVLCRIFQKSGPGPKNGEQYGAPFVEEEWDDDEEAIVEPKMMASSLLNYKEISPEPHILMDVPFLVPKNEDDAISGTAAPGPSRVSIDSGQNVIDSEDFLDEIDQFLLHSGGRSDDGINSSSGDEIVELNGHEQNLDLCMLEKNPLPAQEWNGYDEFAYPDTQILQEQKDVDPIAHDGIEDICKPELEEIYQPLENDYYLELDDLSQPVDPQSSAVKASEVINSASTYFGAYASFPAEDGSFLEINDLSNPVDPDSSGFEMLDDLMHFFDATESNLYEFGSSSRVFEQADIVNCHPNIKSAGVEETLMPDEAQRPSHVHVADQSTPKTASDAGPWTYDKILKGKRSDRIPRRTDNNPEGGWVGSLSKRVQGMLESIPAPPAAAAEYPIKAIKAGIQAPAVYSQSSIHITTATFRISYDETDEEPLCKMGYLSFSVKDYIYPPESITNPSDRPAILEFSGRKAFQFFVRCCLHVFGLVMLLAVGHKLRSCICAR